MTMLAAVGGSTNAIIHLCAVAGRRGLALPLREFGEVSARVPVMVDLAPIGTGLMPDLAAAGGVPTVLAALGSELDLSVPAASAVSIGESLRSRACAVAGRETGDVAARVHGGARQPGA